MPPTLGAGGRSGRTLGGSSAATASRLPGGAAGGGCGPAPRGTSGVCRWPDDVGLSQRKRQGGAGGGGGSGAGGDGGGAEEPAAGPGPRASVRAPWMRIGRGGRRRRRESRWAGAGPVGARRMRPLVGRSRRGGGRRAAVAAAAPGSGRTSTSTR